MARRSLLIILSVGLIGILIVSFYFFNPDRLVEKHFTTRGKRISLMVPNNHKIERFDSGIVSRGKSEIGVIGLNVIELDPSGKISCADFDPPVPAAFTVYNPSLQKQLEVCKAPLTTRNDDKLLLYAPNMSDETKKYGLQVATTGKYLASTEGQTNVKKIFESFGAN